MFYQTEVADEFGARSFKGREVLVNMSRANQFGPKKPDTTNGYQVPGCYIPSDTGFETTPTAQRRVMRSVAAIVVAASVRGSRAEERMQELVKVGRVEVETVQLYELQVLYNADNN